MDKLKLFLTGVIYRLPIWMKPPYSGKQLIIFLLAILFLATAIAGTVFLGIKPKSVAKVAENLQIVSAYPQSSDVSQHAPITIIFNYPVEAHHMMDFYQITPDIKGKWQQGGDASKVIFQPDDVLPLGVSYTVVIKSGLTSTNGKKLINDYTFYFKVTGRSDIITFSRGDENEGKFMSFPQSSGAELTLKVGVEIKDPKVKIYKAGSKDLLNSLVYRVVADEYGNEKYPKSGTFIDNVIDTSTLLPVKIYDQVETGQVISLKENTGLYLLQGFDGDRNISNAWVSLDDSVIHFRQDDQKNCFRCSRHLYTSSNFWLSD